MVPDVKHVMVALVGPIALQHFVVHAHFEGFLPFQNLFKTYVATVNVGR